MPNALVALAALALVSAAPAQGRLVRTAGPLILEAPREAEGALDHLAEVAPEIVPRVEAALGLEPRAPYRLVLIPAGAFSDPEVTALDRRAPAWAAGFMDPAARIGGIRLAQAARYPYGTPEAVLAHESAHLLLHDAPGLQLPLWFEEGIATWVARDWQLEDVLLLSGRLLTRDLPRLDSLERAFHGAPARVEEAYAASFAFVSWCSRRYGDRFVRDVLLEARTRSFERAWTVATGEPLDRAESVWRRDSLFRYRWFPAIAAFSTLWLGVLLLSAWVWVRKRMRARALEAAWGDDEAVAGEEEWWREGGTGDEGEVPSETGGHDEDRDSDDLR